MRLNTLTFESNESFVQSLILVAKLVNNGCFRRLSLLEVRIDRVLVP
jgi:hypothetical protein